MPAAEPSTHCNAATERVGPPAATDSTGTVSSSAYNSATERVVSAAGFHSLADVAAAFESLQSEDDDQFRKCSRLPEC